MKTKSNNLQVARWTEDPALQEEFFTEIAPTIDDESKRWIRFYGISVDRKDLASEMRLKLWQQMREKPTDGPFAKDSPKEAADSLKATFEIREPIRWDARKLGNKQRRQADILAQVGPPDLPRDIETELFAIVESLPRIASATPNFTQRDRDILFKEVARQIGLDDLSAEKFDQAAQALEVSSSELRSYFKDHDRYGHSCARDRKAWSRARAKVVKALTKAKLMSLLVIVLAVSLALYSHQNDSVDQGTSIRQNALRHQENLIEGNVLAHQGLIRQKARAQQAT